MYASAIRKQTFTPIGIDVKDRAVYAVQLRRTRDGLRLHGAASATFEPDGGVLEAVRDAVRQGAFSGSDVVSAVPNTEVDVRPVQLPREIDSDRHPGFRDALRMEAASCLLYRPEEAVIDYLPLEGQSDRRVQGIQVLLIASKKECVNRHLALLRAAKLRCAHIEASSCAAARALAVHDEHLAIVDYGPKCTTITMTQGRHLLFSRTVRSGLQNLVAAVVRGYHVTEDEAIRLLCNVGICDETRSPQFAEEVERTGCMRQSDLAASLYELCFGPIRDFSSEIRRSLEYFSAHRSGFQPERVLLIGPVIPLSIEKCLSSTLNTPIQRPESLSQFKPNGTAWDPAYVVAAGLAMRGAIG